MVHIPLPSQYEKEHRLTFKAHAPEWTYAVVSGSVGGSLMFGGNEDDDTQYVTTEVHLVVGPWWGDVQDVVPYVSVDGMNATEPDVDDEAGWQLHTLTWDTVGGGEGPNADEERIRLKFFVEVKGGHWTVLRLGYYLTAGGRRLGANGINSP